MSIYEKIVIVVLRFLSVLWFFSSLMNFGTMFIVGKGIFGPGLLLPCILPLLLPLVLFFAAQLLAKIITAGIE